MRLRCLSGRVRALGHVKAAPQPDVHPNDNAPARPGESRLLVADLLGDDPVAAETAAARLAILGRPSVRALVGALEAATAPQRVRLIGVLERLGDAAALPALATAVTHEDADTAEAAVGALAALLQAPKASVSAAALDHLTAATLDRGRPSAVRVAALRALGTVDLEAVSLVRAQLLSDPDATVRALAARGDMAATSGDGNGDGESAPDASPVTDDRRAGAAPGAPDTTRDAPEAGRSIAAAIAGRLPDDPETLRRALAHAGEVSLGDLHRLVVVLREAERGGDAPQAAGWLSCRAAAHQALASRGSRLAVYDLRDALEALGPRTPVGMLSALRDVGDAASLDAVAEAWTGHDDGWFRQQLASVTAAIVARDGLTRRHAVARRLAQRWPAAVAALWPAPQ